VEENHVWIHIIQNKEKAEEIFSSAFMWFTKPHQPTKRKDVFIVKHLPQSVNTWKRPGN